MSYDQLPHVEDHYCRKTLSLQNHDSTYIHASQVHRNPWLSVDLLFRENNIRSGAYSEIQTSEFSREFPVAGHFLSGSQQAAPFLPVVFSPGRPAGVIIVIVQIIWVSYDCDACVWRDNNRKKLRDITFCAPTAARQD